MARVSVITALYNHEPFIAQAIESVLAQTYEDYEHILFDDGSKDRSLEIARQYAEKNPDKVKVFTHPGGANRGQENTRNAAIEKATGELLCLLDSDDFYHPRKLEHLVPRFSDPRVGLAYGEAEIVSEPAGTRTPSGVSQHPEGHVFDALVEENFLLAGATLFRRECVKDGSKFDPTFRTCGEYPLWIKIAKDWKLAYEPHVVAYWRKHGENLSSKLALQAKLELVRLAERLAQDPEYADRREALIHALARKRYDYANELYRYLELKQVRELCRLVARDKSAPRELRTKASILGAIAGLGPIPNQFLSVAKRKIWEWRHPLNTIAGKGR